MHLPLHERLESALYNIDTNTGPSICQARSSMGGGLHLKTLNTQKEIAICSNGAGSDTGEETRYSTLPPLSTLSLLSEMTMSLTIFKGFNSKQVL